MNPSRQSSALLLAAGFALTALAASAQNRAADESYLPPSPPAKSGTPLSTTPPPEAGTPANAREITVEQFMAIDTDYDGRISLDEFLASPVLSGRAEAQARSATSGTPRADETTKAAPEAKGRNTAELFHRLDKNENGYLNTTELAAFYETDATL